MQATKSRPGSLDVPQKPSPATPRTARKLKASGSDSGSSSSPKTKTPKDKSPKVVDRRSPRSPALEKKKMSRLSELEPQLAQLQAELQKATDELSSTESSKRRAQQEAEEAKKQLAAMSAKLEETRSQFMELSESEESRVQELRKISQDRDKVWQSELEAVQKQHAMDSSALASALNEIQRLKIEIARVYESEDCHSRHAESASNEIRSLRIELSETGELVEKLKNQLNESRESEARALEEVVRAQMLLEVVKSSEETIRLEHANALKSYELLVDEMEKSKKKVDSLEELVGNLQTDIDQNNEIRENGECEESKMIDDLKNEATQLRNALEEAERRYQEQYLESTMQIREAYEMVKREKSESTQKEAALEAKLEASKAEVKELKAKMMEKGGLDRNMEKPESESVLEALKTSLLEKELKLQITKDENEKLKSEIMEAVEAARAGEREAVMKLGYITEEADKSCRKAERVTEELDAAQTANVEMEAELRRLKVQSDQWRKAAEAAAAMLSTGKFVEKKNGSLDYHTIGGKLSCEDTDDESPKKKNGNVLKKIGVLLKKGQK